MSLSSIKETIKNLIVSLVDTLLPSLKKLATELIVAAENSLEGSTGAEKRAYVVQQLDEALELSGVLELCDGWILGLLVDVVCDRLNLLTDHDITSVTTAEQVETVAETLTATDEEITAETAEAATVDEKLAVLYEKYGIAKDEPDSE